LITVVAPARRGAGDAGLRHRCTGCAPVVTATVVAVVIANASQTGCTVCIVHGF